MTAESVLLALSDTALDAVIAVDSIGRIVHVNEAACLLLGGGIPLPPSRLLTRGLMEVTHLRSLLELCQSAVAAGSAQEADIRLGIGAERLLRARARPLDDGRVALVLSDRTELAHLRTVRTEFVANVSHELRTPLAAVRAMAETLLGGALNDPEVSERFLETIIREVDRLVRLSEDLLLLSRAESSERDVTRFDLRELLADVVERLEPYAERREIAVVRSVGDRIVWIDGDRGQLDQVFFNLLDNAIKYTPPQGQVTLNLEPATGSAPPTTRVTIADTGIGILSEDLPRIFERFWRADRARKFPGEGGTATGGTGLGLSIVKHIVEAHGGSVQATSELGQGSRFTVCLPTLAEVPSGP